MNYEPQTREELEDAMVAARDFARMTRGQFEAFLEAGFMEAHALHLTAMWLTAQINAGRGS